MKDGKTQTQIAYLMGRHKSTINRELARNTDTQASLPVSRGRSLGSRNVPRITISDWNEAVDCLGER